MSASLSTQLLFELCIVVPLDRPLISVRKGVWISSHEQPPSLISSIFAFSSASHGTCFVPRPHRCGMHLGMYATIVSDSSLCGCLFIRTYA